MSNRGPLNEKCKFCRFCDRSVGLGDDSGFRHALIRLSYHCHWGKGAFLKGENYQLVWTHGPIFVAKSLPEIDLDLKIEVVEIGVIKMAGGLKLYVVWFRK